MKKSINKLFAMKNITFITNIEDTHEIIVIDYSSTKLAIDNKKSIITTQLSFLSFDLLNVYNNIFLIHEKRKYHLQLGNNDWIFKDLRIEHDLFKIVNTYILNERKT
jgi:hypothetical protein